MKIWLVKRSHEVQKLEELHVKLRLMVWIDVVI